MLTEYKDEELIQQMVIDVMTPKGYKNIRANAGEYDTPAKLSRKNADGEQSFIPDATGVINGRKSYFELAVKSERIQSVVTKWKLLSSVARFKEGKFFLVAPKGHFAFVDRLRKQYSIQAEVLKM